MTFSFYAFNYIVVDLLWNFPVSENIKTEKVAKLNSSVWYCGVGVVFPKHQPSYVPKIELVLISADEIADLISLDARRRGKSNFGGYRIVWSSTLFNTDIIYIHHPSEESVLDPTTEYCIVAMRVIAIAQPSKRAGKTRKVIKSAALIGGTTVTKFDKCQRPLRGSRLEDSSYSSCSTHS